jgi:acetylornithine deacetylase
MLDPVEMLQRLIQIPSVNPMGRPISEAIQGESRLTEFLQSVCEERGWRWLSQQVHPGRENLVALVTGEPAVEQGGELLLWDVHQDTVAVEGMTVEPFGGEVRGGRVYGRGSSDVKGAMAAMLVALAGVSGKTHCDNGPDKPSLATASSEQPRPSLKGRGNTRRPTIVVAFTANEECGFTGARRLCELWNPERRGAVDVTSGNISPEELFPRRPDAAIVAEPTQFNVVVAHHGVVRWRCHTIGRAAHTSRPDEGVNAIYAMSRVVQAIERYHQNLRETATEHPLCGRPSVCVSTIHGGVGVNTVPERATIEIDRRLGPEERPAAAYEELVRFIAEHAGTSACRIEHDPPFMDSSGLSDSQNRPFAERIERLMKSTGRGSEIVGVPFGTDAAAISAAGVPTVVFGPGDIAQAHTCDEFIEVDQLQLGVEVFGRIARGELA